MPIGVRPKVAAHTLCVSILFGAHTALAQSLVGAPTIALKSGEATELADLYWVVNCRSQLKATPTVEVMDGPPGIAVTVKDAKIVPRFQGCAKPVAGGKVMITANEVDDYSHTRLTIRVTYRTRDGERQRSGVYNLTLFP
jgi:hypothetical protein